VTNVPQGSAQRGLSEMIPPREEIRRQVQLTWGKAIRISWRNIHMRLGRSLLVTSGIVLAIAFLTYVLLSSALMAEGAGGEQDREARGVPGAAAGAPPGEIEAADAPESRAQTVWMVALALLVCFVGVLNAMLLSVTERFAEIGTMKCLGALDSLIVKLFLLESLFQGIVGTSVGIAVGAALAAAEAFSGGTVADVAAVDVLEILALCFLAGVVLTMAGALYPALRAAQMRPVEAMQTEL
jgi:hypothetical protein